jgi:hypothetical protein
MRALVALVLAVLAAPRTEGQATWGGLRFGMTPEEVKDVIGDRAKAGSPSKDAPPGEFTLEVSPVKVGDVAGTARLIFAGSPSRLRQVSLNFSRVGRGCAPDEAKVAAERLETVRVISDQLLEKYGKPTSETGPWPSSEVLARLLSLPLLRRVEAERMWRVPGQIIREWLSTICNSVLLTVSYKPVDAASEL